MSVQKGNVAISEAVTPVMSTLIASVVVCSKPVSDFGTERPVTPVPIVTALYSAEGFSAVFPVPSGGHADATVIDVAIVPRGVQNVGAVVSVVLTEDSWGRDAQMVEGLFQIMEGMEPPWITLSFLEAAVLRFPLIDSETLRLTIMTMMMTQRRCVGRLTRAGLRRGPRVDRDGNAFVELDLDYADRYSTSH